MTEAEAEWTRCRPWLEAALEHACGTHLIEDVEDAIARGEAHFWPGRQSAVVTEFHEFPRLKALHFWLAGGDLEELLNRMLPDITAWAKAHGCTRMTLAGRPGWRRALAPHGFDPHWHICAKDVQ